jgi:uncharacterized membrane protein
MAKTVCKIFGIVLLLVGIVGFLQPTLLGLHLTTLHNIVHLLSGAIALYYGFSGSYAGARTFSQVFGGIYLLLGLLGFIAPNVIMSIIGHTAAGSENLMPDNVVHLLIGAVFLVVGFLRAPQPAAT